VKGNPGGPGRPPGSKDSFPRNSYRAMLEIIAGRIEKTLENEKAEEVNKTAAEVMADAIFDGMAGQLVLRSDKHGTTIANPLHAVKLYHDFMWKAKELKLRKAELKKNQTGTGGGIRIVLPSVPADPLLRPGQTPRPLRLLGQDPDKPLPDTTGTTTKAPATKAPASSPGTVPCAKLRRQIRSSRANRGLRAPDLRMLHGARVGPGRERIEMVKCGACEGVGRAPVY
jgi:hypothetical protein